ncbi:Glu-tRNA(Gln) amidotransferase subunit GatD [Methanobacterium alcaliphilum]|uniref:Glu-tRNA(Gln) amidotransferase subunit GatD n=1 Tax=Methanobacterium alcaliphilum TaxID=392018 RepID=UPI002009FBD9|nr:Glu-tRNA(Gln) amidotransferase subunit GatD [Methanobacterium alcaliphilum]MCK9152093.1 Glu-tRNA(Gln) amidotransferase subunit GatD [Methanobacterium alcaliphilum]
MNYQGFAEKLLKSLNVSIGDTLKIVKPDISYEGMLLDRSEDADDQHLVLKLESGYNIGINISEATVEIIKKSDKPKIELPSLNIKKDDVKPNVSIISTGGTVASIIDYKTGAVHPAFDAEDLIRANPELLEYANITGKSILNILSENMKPEYWVKAANSIADEISDGSYGVVVAHGTDTMHYTAAALSFILETPVPIIITGAQRSSDRPSSDAFLNLINSVSAAKSDIAEVMVCMHGTSNDSTCYLHRGTKVRKMHTSRRETFRSINTTPLAEIENGALKIDSTKSFKKRNEVELTIKDNIEPKVAYIKSFPGIQSEIIDYHLDKGYKGILLEGTGLGHCPENMVSSLERATDSNVPVVMTSQCLYGKVNMNVYSTGRKIMSAGAISGEDMLPETAYVKLIWALGQSDKLDEVKKIMITNIAGEMEEKSSMDYFLN